MRHKNRSPKSNSPPTAPTRRNPPALALPTARPPPASMPSSTVSSRAKSSTLSSTARLGPRNSIRSSTCCSRNTSRNPPASASSSRRSPPPAGASAACSVTNAANHGSTRTPIAVNTKPNGPAIPFSPRWDSTTTKFVCVPLRRCVAAASTPSCCPARSTSTKSSATNVP